MKKLTLAEMKVLAKNRGGFCLSESYHHSKIKLKWRCKERHEWKALPTSIKSGSWCKQCAVKKIADKRRIPLSEIQNMAHLNKGECLSLKYQGNKEDKLRWQCKEGHKWEASLGKVRSSNSWCPTCARLKRRLNLGEMQRLARSKNGICLSDSYHNINTKLKWQCHKGHEWEATTSHIKGQGCWCPTCAGRDTVTIKQMHLVANSWSGKCLSKKVINALTKLRWRCVKKHEWEATPNDIKSGHWCRKCAAKNRAAKQRTPIAEIQDLAISRNGECLTKEYDDARVKLRWRCSRKHEWEASLRNVKHNKSWCPTCGAGVSERLCRAIFESLFSTPFPPARPEWLLNDRGNRMHLDGYAEKLNLAFEYQGIQHFKELVFFHKSKEAFFLRKKDDRKKSILCRKFGVKLITISYKKSFNEIENYIRSKCAKAGVIIPRIKPVDINKLSIYNDDPLKKLKIIAEAHGGMLLSTAYINRNVKMQWRCAEGHEWQACAGAIRNAGQWCPRCGVKRRSEAQRLSIDDMHASAKARKGKFLSNKYSGTRFNYLWECELGHQWQAKGNNVRSGSWCPKCK